MYRRPNAVGLSPRAAHPSLRRFHHPARGERSIPPPPVDVVADAATHRVSTIVSNPIGFPQQALLVSTIESSSMTAAAPGLATVLNSPYVFGSVPEIVKTVDEFRRPVIV